MGLSIQNEDVKSKEQLALAGATPDHLIHDKKIWVTANDILKPLDQAIEEGDIGAEVGVGSAFAHRTIVYGDGSTEEYGATQPPFVESGNTIIETDYIIQEDAFIRVLVDKEEYISYVSDSVTPDFWFKRQSDSRIEIKGDHTASPIRLEVQILEGVDLPPILSSLYAGMDLRHEAYGYADGSGSSDGIVGVSVVSGKTEIELSHEFTKDDYVFVYINNEYYIPFKTLALTPDKYYEIKDNPGGANSTIILDDDYTGQPLPFYIAVFRGQFHQDELGNVCFEIGATVDVYSTTSPNTTVWELQAENTGALAVESGSLVSPDPIRIKRDDNVTVSIEVTDLGEVVVDDSPTPGVLFTNLWIVSPDGTVWALGVDTDNEVYLDDAPSDSNKFCLQDSEGNIVHEVRNTADGAIFKLKHFFEGNLPTNPEQTTQNTLLAIEQNPVSGPRLVQYDTFDETWKTVGGGTLVGEIKISVLEPTEFKATYGNEWEPMDGSVTLDATVYDELAALVPDWVDGNDLSIPDATDYDMGVNTFAQETGDPWNSGPDGALLPPPDGFEGSDHWAGVSSPARMQGGMNSMINIYNPSSEGVYVNINHSSESVVPHAQLLSLYRKKRKEQRYIKVK